MNNTTPKNNKLGLGPITILLLANLIAIALKFAISHQGHTYDFSSYLIVSDIVTRGGNVYTETSRYNYGPLWFWILGALRYFFRDPANFHLSLVSLLAFVDLVISFWIAKRISFGAGLLFALNPISLLISGYYLQFDCLALLFAFLSIDLLSKAERTDSFGDCLCAGGLLGVSLALKHVLIFFPICILLKNLNAKNLLCFFTAYAGFFGLFLPFVSTENIGAIWQNVFLYQSAHNVGFLRGFLEKLSLAPGPEYSSYFFGIVMLAAALLVGWMSIGKGWIKYLAIHLAIIFCFLPGMAPQYLVFLLPLWMIYPRNLYLILAAVLGSLLVAAISPGLLYGRFDHRLLRLAIPQLLVLAALASLFLNRLENRHQERRPAGGTAARGPRKTITD